MKNILNKRLEQLSLDEFSNAVEKYLQDFSDYIDDDMIKEVYTNKRLKSYLVETVLSITRSKAIGKKAEINKKKAMEEMSSFKGIFVGSNDQPRGRNKPVSSIRNSRDIFFNTEEGEIIDLSHNFKRKTSPPPCVPFTVYDIYKKDSEPYGRNNIIYKNLIEAKEVTEDGEIKVVDKDELVALLDNIVTPVEDVLQYEWVVLKGRIRSVDGRTIFKDGKPTEEFEPIAQSRWSGAVLDDATPTMTFVIHTEDGDLIRTHFPRQKYGIPNMSMGEDFIPIIEDNIQLEPTKAIEWISHIYQEKPVLVVGQIYKKDTAEDDDRYYIDMSGVAIFKLPSDEKTWIDTYERSKMSSELSKTVDSAIKKLGEQAYDNHEEVYKAIAHEITAYDKNDVMKEIVNYFEEG